MPSDRSDPLLSKFGRAGTSPKNDRQNDDRHNGANQTGKKDCPASRCREDDFSSSGLFSRIWFPVHH